MSLTRREAIARLALLTGGAIFGAEAFLRGAPIGFKPGAADFTDDDRALLDEVGETIIPATGTPGAKAAGVGAFMTTMVRDCYERPNHITFHNGLGQLEAACHGRFGAPFRSLTAAQRHQILSELDHAGVAYFRMMKQLTLLGYFTSEIGCTQALRYIETPGAYRSDPYHSGDKAWYVPPTSPSV